MKTKITDKKTKGKKGGKRNGAGRKAGSLNKTTLTDKIVLEEIRDRVIKAKDTLINSQMSLAIGSTYLMCQKYDNKGKKKGKAFIIDNPETIIAFLDGELEGSRDVYYYMTTKRPDNKAIDSLFNRALGKPVETINGNLGLDDNAKDALKRVDANFVENIIKNFIKNNGITK